MIIIVLLIFISLCIAGFFLLTYIWAVKSGQYDDTYSPGIRILFDEQSRNEEKDEPGEDQKV
ncbi:cbb3-type cytochrome oxidase assembly protein CcoS [Fulvivirgaceae bacterium BMA12]|uniref:Cbb3-type cytochrome oxidase assembly protein CcoS n=1 Tax=Agaribacillus aureus TaxID=3051825 RepID=A0ABT8L9X9_9BACT|nr:cbb3-type cytochrome oxidase assembly protein CcoS [Fulvivirgaceae bacterium BMA12]